MLLLEGCHKSSGKTFNYLLQQNAKKQKFNPNKYIDYCIACDSCIEWFHFNCAGIRKGKKPGENDKWICINYQST